MAALTAGRNAPEFLGDIQEYGAQAAAVAFAGGLAVLSAAGYCAPGSVATTLKAVGAFIESKSNAAGANAAVNFRVKPGTYRFNNSSAGDLITIADLLLDCYIVDDQTVAKTNGTSTRSVAGKIIQVDAQGVWVRVGIV
jgi:hypothetical protein